MWSIEIEPWQWQSTENYNNNNNNNIKDKTKTTTTTQHLIKAKAKIASILSECNTTTESSSSPSSSTSSRSTTIETRTKQEAFQDGGRMSRVTLSHLLAHRIADATPITCRLPPPTVTTDDGTTQTELCTSPSSVTLTISSLSTVQDDTSLHRSRRRQRRMRKASKNSSTTRFPPFVLERTDVWCDDTYIHVTLRSSVVTPSSSSPSSTTTTMSSAVSSSSSTPPMNNPAVHQFIQTVLDQVTQSLLTDNGVPPPNTTTTTTTTTQQPPPHDNLLSHIATIVLQAKLRAILPSLNAVSFIANGSILPRKSGESAAPMASPPAIPFAAPEDSPMNRKISIDMGKLRPFLDDSILVNHCHDNDEDANNSDSMITLQGLLIPKGVTLIVGGGYHGKSTLLRTIASGVYNRIPGDGREFCVTDSSAISVRAEDGRSVNGTNVAAFISNLPTMGGTGTSTSSAGTTNTTTWFQTTEASGSTSQAANTSEAIEMRASALLIDEDVSAANFMSRDGRMRALIMDESITPLLYRVNGIYTTLGISSIVVVGGVGDWLDVPHAVVLLQRYVAYDALEKAQSVSKQFSYGHVQYAGRGVVHRLVWDGVGTPGDRRIVNAGEIVGRDCEVSLLDGGGKLLFCSDDDGGDDIDDDCYILDKANAELKVDEPDEDLGTVDMTRCEQLLGGNWQLFGCGICALWILKASTQNPKLSLNQLLDNLETDMDNSGGIIQAMRSVIGHSPSTEEYLSTKVGFVYRPRRYEVFMALTRMRGLKFELIPPAVDSSVIEAEKAEEKKKKALADQWANRRKKKKW